MADPIGRGERSHPPEGNALLVTQSLRGADIQNPLWIESVATDLNLQMDSAQLREGLSHRPIRLLERMVVISTLWTLNQRKEYEDFIKNLKAHWARNLNEDRPTPMKLWYYGANKRWLGFVGGAMNTYAVTDVVLRRPLTMRILPVQSEKVSRIVGDANSPIVPTSETVHDFGPEWYRAGELRKLVRVGMEGSSQTHKPHADATDDRHPPQR